MLILMPRFDRSFVDEILGRTSILDIVGRKVTWDKRKSNVARGDMWACCPFHAESTPSFHATDAKGSYHCFGCGVHGNALDFVMASENLTFPEAVERMARDLGLALPERDPDAEAKDDLAERVTKVMAAASAAFGQALRSSDGAKARAYLQKRGLGEADWARFGIGYSPNSRTWLRDKLTQGGYGVADMVEAGLLKAPEDGGPAFDFFRGRVMFTIEDARGRVVSFGARTLDPDGQPKYLNGPDSLVFNKSRNLYRYAQARFAAKDKPILVAEGYIDVIALERAGFAAVAPLGTALTEDQLALIWKASKRPILCFDGDKAGIKAAQRALDRALPMVSADKTLAFGFMPEGQDPDDVIRAKGAGAIDATIAAAMPLGEFLFEREQEREPLNSAEARAGLRKRLRALISQVTDPDLQRELNDEMKRRLDTLFAPAPRAAFVPQRMGRAREGLPLGHATTELRLKIKATSAKPSRALIDLVAAPIRVPGLLEGGEETFATLIIDDPGLNAVRHSLLDLHHSGKPIDFDAVRIHLRQSSQEHGVTTLDQIRSHLVVSKYVGSGDRKDLSDMWLAEMGAYQQVVTGKRESKELLKEADRAYVDVLPRIAQGTIDRRVKQTQSDSSDPLAADIAELHKKLAEHDREILPEKFKD
jgi:DNA primase